MSGLPLPDPLPDTGAADAEALDLQHDTDPAEDHSHAPHIPHLGHVALLVAMFLLTFALVGSLLPSLLHLRGADLFAHPGVALAIEALTYAIVLPVAFFVFPLLWDQPFSRGIDWNLPALRRRWPWLLLAALVLCAVGQGIDQLLPQPREVAVEKLMHSAMDAWGFTLMAVTLGPLTEEIVFRGFLLPALAIAYDWLLLDRTPAAHTQWQQSTLRSLGAWIFGAFFSSIAFAVLHAPQVDHAWGVVALLFCISLALSWVRIRFHSVACSTCLHAAYNLAIFVIPLIASGGYRHLDKLQP